MADTTETVPLPSFPNDRFTFVVGPDFGTAQNSYVTFEVNPNQNRFIVQQELT